MISPTADQIEKINRGEYDAGFSSLYGDKDLNFQKARYLRLLNLLEKKRSGRSSIVISAPGRTELAGNHTDHNNGCVLAAAVDLDCVAVVSPIKENEIVLHSEEYSSPVHIDLNNLTPRPEEEGTAEALARGVASYFYETTGQLGGFYGWINSTCKPGTGLSSSAAFSVLLGAAFNFLYGANRLGPEDLAHMAKKAENNFFGKPCGLMDQMASSVGRTVFIDFRHPDSPELMRVERSLQGSGYQLAIIDTGGSHIELTPEYAVIPEEMKAAAAALGEDTAREISLERFLDTVSKTRSSVGDRATLRLLHFIEENKRTKLMAEHLIQGDFTRYLQSVEQSGYSSLALLQNCASSSSSREQGVLLGLAMSKRICPQAISRVHGGGFAGTIQAYVPEQDCKKYKNYMEQIFGHGSVRFVIIGRPGVVGIGSDDFIVPGNWKK